MKKYFIVGFLMVVLMLVLPTFVKAENTSVNTTAINVNTNTSAQNLIISSQQQLSQLLEQINKLQAELSRLQGEVKKVGEQIEKLTKSLKMGAEGKEVEILQNFLKQDPTVYPEGKVTGYYGPLTEKAVKKFQQKNGIESVGVVGPVTMAKINGIIENKEESKITICHIPDGNTANKQTITISKSAWEAHKAHGDTENTCVSTQPIPPIACTTDAKLCSNGSYVSRIGPNCEFAACPTSQYYINVVSPNGGETWTTGSLQYIKWSSNLSATHKIITVRLRDYAGREYDLLNSTLNDGIEQITVPVTLVAGLYTLEIKTFLDNQTVFDKSDATFNIVAPTPTPTSCSESWSCGGWSSCTNNIQTKTCSDINSCGTTNTRPALSQSCTPTPVTTIPDVVTISGRLIDYFTKNPVNVVGSQITSNPNGEFSTNVITSTINTATPKGYGLSADCHYSQGFVVRRANDGSLTAEIQAHVLTGEPYQSVPIITPFVRFADVSMWPAVDIMINTDVAAKFSIWTSSRTGSGNNGFKNTHMLTNAFMLESDPYVTLTDAAGNSFVSPTHHEPLSYGCKPEVLSYYGGVFKWEEYPLDFDPVGYNSYSSGDSNLIVGNTYNRTVGVSGGVAPYTWSVVTGTLPPGIILSPSGVFSGTPTEEGTFPLMLKATDANGVSNALMWTLKVNPIQTALSAQNQMANVLGAMQGILNQLQELLKNR